MAILAIAGALVVPSSWATEPQQGQAQQKQDAKATPSVAGKWNMTLEMSTGTGTPILQLKQDGDKITGSYSGRYGTFPLEGSLKERAIVFSVAMTVEGTSVTISFVGEVAADGQTMKGSASLAEMGDLTWTAKKEKTA
jgi:hypothetical protein